MYLNIALISLPVGYITHKIIEKIYPGKTKKLLITTGWNIMQCCSYLEVKVSMIYNKIRGFLPSLIKKEISLIKIIKDGDETACYNIDDFLMLKNKINTNDYDFIIYEHKNNEENNNTYMIRYDNHEEIAKIEYNRLNCIKLNVIKFNFKDSEKGYNINFNDKQYLVNGNVLFDRMFLKWFMNKHYNLNINSEDKYNISFIDHEMNYISINETKCIVIKKDGYDIIEESIDDNSKSSTEDDSFTLL
jgi:hypothetical protein